MDGRFPVPAGTEEAVAPMDGRFPVPAGTTGNSPVFQGWDGRIQESKSPGGTTGRSAMVAYLGCARALGTHPSNAALYPISRPSGTIGADRPGAHS